MERLVQLLKMQISRLPDIEDFILAIDEEIKLVSPEASPPCGVRPTIDFSVHIICSFLQAMKALFCMDDG